MSKIPLKNTDYNSFSVQLHPKEVLVTIINHNIRLLSLYIPSELKHVILQFIGAISKWLFDATNRHPSSKKNRNRIFLNDNSIFKTKTTWETVPLTHPFGSIPMNTNYQITLNIKGSTIHWMIGIIEPTYYTWSTCFNNGNGCLLDFYNGYIRVHNRKTKVSFGLDTNYWFGDLLTNEVTKYNFVKNVYDTIESKEHNSVLPQNNRPNVTFCITIAMRLGNKSIFRIENVKNKCYLEFVGISQEMRLGVSLCDHKAQIVSQNFVQTEN